MQKIPELPKEYQQPKLSTTPGFIQPFYDVVVIGSGYGGAIAANRLSRSAKQAADGSWVRLSIALLERGKEWSTGSFPETDLQAQAEAQIIKSDVGMSFGHTNHLYEVNTGDDITVFKGCGLGGTSLVNANVALETVPDILKQAAWPEELRQEGVLKDWYDRARSVLQPEPHPVERTKYKALKKTAGGILKEFDFEFDAKVDIEDTDKLIKAAEEMKLVYLTPINVNNKDHKDGNKFGVPQQACNACGNCVSGCNVGAKNTLMMNYLPDARAHGVEMFTSVYVRHIEKDAATGHYMVHYSILQGGFEAHKLFVRAANVVVSGGSLGSTEIMLQSRKNGLDISEQVGNRFTGNGDAIGFSYKNKHSVNSIGEGPDTVHKPAKAPGPCITGIIDMRALGRGKKNPNKGFLLEDGTPPYASTPFIWPLVMASGLATGDMSNPADFMRRYARDHIDCTLAYLCMSHDDSGGRMTLRPDNNGVVITWPEVGKQEQFNINYEAMKIGAKHLDGKAVRNPMWAKSLGSQLITVHPLGGCCMGKDGSSGVVNHKGQVFAPKDGPDAVHAGLYVMDGAVMPTSLGVNPLLTISAVSERNVALMIQDKGWREADLSFTGEKNRELFKRQVQTPGVIFSERMAGYLINADALPADIQTKDWVRPYKTDWKPMENANKSQRVHAEFILTICGQDVDKMVSERKHWADTAGVFICPLLSAQPMTVRNGRFQLFPDSDYEKNTKNMIYTFTADSHEGKKYAFRGTKFVHQDHWWEIGVRDTTTLFVTVHEVVDEKALPPGPCKAAGVLQIALSDFYKQLKTMRVINCPDPQERAVKLAKFVEFFADSTLEVYCPVARGLNKLFLTDEQKEAARVELRPRLKRELKLGDVVPEIIPLPCGDKAEMWDGKEMSVVDVELRLTRFKGGSKGPLLVIHGYGVSSLTMSIDTVEENFVEYLVAKEYDVFLLDWRASINLPWCHTKYDLDQVAKYDHPAAVKKVMELTGAKDIQVICHCVGSITFFMSLLGGFIDRSWLRTVAVSQVAYDLIPHTSFTKMAALLSFPSFLGKIGMPGLDVNEDKDGGFKSKLFQSFGNTVGALRALPIGGEWCDSEDCHRISFLYGLLWKHKNMNKLTHDTLGESFGFAGVQGLAHLSDCIANVNPKCAKVREKDPNRPVYNQFKNLSMPIRFVSGELNYCFDPKATAASITLAREVQPLSDRVVIPKYGHIDVFMGEHANKDCYHVFEEFLSKHANFTLTPEQATSIDGRQFAFTAKGGCCTVL